MPSRSLTPFAVLGSLILACAHPRAAERAAVDAERAAQLVAWDTLRRRAEAGLLAIPLPSVSLRDAAIAGDGHPQVVAAAVPRLTPHLASVAIAWPTICERRGVLPDDVFDYAAAWCRHARDGNRWELHRVLVRVMSSTVPGLRAAALEDLVNVVADAYPAASAIRVLTKVGAPPRSLEQLAAMYRGLGREEDEAVVRARLPRPRPPTDCAELSAALEDFEPHSLSTIRRVAAGSTSCALLARSIACRIDVVSKPAHSEGMCARAVSGLRDDEVREAHYLAAYAHWGTDWFAAVDHAVKAMPEPGAEQVALAALSSALRSSCAPARLREVHERAHLLLGMPAHDARWTPALRVLATITPATCDDLQAAARPSP